ncbi:hypothetical protein IAD21_02306 [Abditibacteriota bacterium]|nr:hypothetical protein IAD21_02306 [Abditibacteriota bacterium]
MVADFHYLLSFTPFCWKRQSGVLYLGRDMKILIPA